MIVTIDRRAGQKVVRASCDLFLFVVLVFILTILMVNCSGEDDASDVNVPDHTITFMKIISNGFNNNGRDVVQSVDGGYIITGYIKTGEFLPSNDLDLFYLKTNSSGSVVWTKFIEDVGIGKGGSICRTSDENCLIAGSLMNQAVLLKIDPRDGEEIWRQNYDNLGGATSVQETNNGGFVFCGSDVDPIPGRYITRTDEQGSVLWLSRYNCNYCGAYQVIQTSDGGYFLSGTKPRATDTVAPYFLKTNTEGEQEFEGTTKNQFFSAAQCSDGSYFLCGKKIESAQTLYKLSIQRIDSMGVDRGTTYPFGNEPSYGTMIQKTSTGDFVVVGRCKSENTDYDIFLAKLNAQGELLWRRTFDFGGYEIGEAVHETSDSGFIIVGRTQDDIVLIKTDQEGNIDVNEPDHTITFMKIISNDFCNYGWDVVQSIDGGYIITGEYTQLPSNDLDLFYLKTDPYGSVVWTKFIEVEGTGKGSSICRTSDGNCLIAGSLMNQAVILKIDPSNGEEIWRKSYDNLGGATSVQETSTGGFVFCGSIGEPGAGRFITRTDEQGSVIWLSHYNCYYCGAYQVIQTSDGGFFLSGTTPGMADTQNPYFLKTNPEGEQEFSGITSNSFFSAAQCDDGSYLLCGREIYFLPYLEKFSIQKIDSMGVDRGTTCPFEDDYSYGKMIQKTSTGDFVVVGTCKSESTDYDIFLAKLNEQRELLWQQTFSSEGTEIGEAVHETNDGGFIIVGIANAQWFHDLDRYLGDIVLIKTDQEGNIY